MGEIRLTLTGEDKGATKAVEDLNKTTTAAVKSMDVTWREFVAARMSEYMKLEGGHAGAMKRMGEEWKRYKETAGTAGTTAVKAHEASVQAADKATIAHRGVRNEVGSLEGKMRSLASTITGVLTTAVLGLSLIGVFNKGIEAVDSFQQSVIQTAAMITSLQGGDNIADNYRRAKEYADGLQGTLQQVDARTTLNLTNLQQITEEMVKQGVVLDNTSAGQVEAFTRIANAVAVYSRNGAQEIQVRQEIRALMMGTVDQNSQLAQLLQRTVDGPLKQQVDKWKQSGTLIEELGKRLSGFGLASDDLNQTWSAVKSSLETSVNLVLRAGFGAIVKDVSEELNRVNEYLKTHREEIGEKIVNAWDKVKAVMGGVAGVAETIWNNFEPFATIIIGGAIIKGVTSMVEIFTTLYRTLLSVQGAMVAIGALSGTAAGAAAAGAGGAVAGAGTAAAGGGILKAIGGGLAGTTVALAGGVGLGYALQPAVRKLDEFLYKKYGWMLTGEAAFRAEEARGLVADQRLSEVMARRNGKPGAAAPQVNLQDTPEQIKEKMDLMGKELAAYKTLQEQKSALAKGQAEIEISVMKARFNQGLVSTRAYYEEETRVALAAAQQQADNAVAYLRKEEETLAFIRSKKGEKGTEYQEELARNQKAVADLQKAQIDYAKIAVDSEAKMIQAMREREEEYGKLINATLEASGKYVAAEQEKQAADSRSIDMLRLKKEAEEGVQGAVLALAAVEKSRSIALAQAQSKENEERRQYASDLISLQNELDKLNGKDQELIDSENRLREGRDKLAALQDRITVAWAQGNITAISGLSQQIQLQDQLNSRLQASQTLLEQVKVLNGEIVGFNGNTPIYAGGGGAFSNGQAVAPYQSPSGSRSGGTSGAAPSSPFVSLNDPWFSFGGARATGGSVKAYTTYRVNEDGTEWLTMGSKGGYITPANKVPSTGLQSLSTGDINIVLPNVTNQSTGADLVREALPVLLRELKTRFAA